MNKNLEKSANKDSLNIVEIITNIMAVHNGVSVDILLSRSQKRKLVYARYSIAWLLREIAKLNDKEIAKIINRERSTVNYGIHQFNNLIQQYDENKQDVINICLKIVIRLTDKNYKLFKN